MTKFNSIKNEILISYEDEDEKWHKVDHQPNELSRTCDTEGTLDGKQVKFRVISVPKDGEGAVRKFGDDCDFNVLDGTQFPPIPPAKAPSRLPKLVHTSQVRIVVVGAMHAASLILTRHCCTLDIHADDEILAPAGQRLPEAHSRIAFSCFF